MKFNFTVHKLKFNYYMINKYSSLDEKKIKLKIKSYFIVR